MNQLSDIAQKLHALASAGELYSKNVFDKERFAETRELAALLLTLSVDGITKDKADELFEKNDGYQTPKAETRAAIFDDKDRVLLVHDFDGKWALPGGWCDYDQTIYSNTIKEAREEAGLDVEPYRLVAVHSHAKRNNPKSFFRCNKHFVLCRVKGGAFAANDETTESAYFAIDEIPENLNTHKTTKAQIELCLRALHSDTWETEVD